MPNFLDNKQIVHIVVELLLFAGIVFFIIKKNKQSIKLIDELKQRINTQDEQIKRLEQIISQMFHELSSLRYSLNNTNQSVPHPIVVVNSPSEEKIPEKTVIKEEITEEPEETEEELDSKLKEELNELQPPLKEVVSN